jgi:hypothetical protein
MQVLFLTYGKEYTHSVLQMQVLVLHTTCVYTNASSFGKGLKAQTKLTYGKEYTLRVLLMQVLFLTYGKEYTHSVLQMQVLYGPFGWAL